MKILFLNHNPMGYGTFWRCLNLGKYLGKSGHQVTLITVSPKEVDLTITKKNVAPNLDLIILPSFKIAQYHTGHTLRAFLNTFYALTLKYDILHSFVFPVHPIAIPTIITKVLRHKPLIIDGDDLWRGGWANYHVPIIKKQLEFCEDKIGFLADKITVVGSYMNGRFLKAGIPENKIAVIPNGASINEIKVIPLKSARQKLGLEENTKYLMVMGHTYTEGLFIFLQAFEKVVQKYQGIKLLFLGKMALSGKDSEKLNKVTGHLTKNIIFLGEKPFSDVPLYLSASDLLILPMDDDPIEKARFPMRFGDYLASGRPIASNAVGEVKFYLEKYQCGLTSSPKDIKGFADNMLAVLGNNEIAVGLGKKARATAEKILAWDHIVEKLEKVYQEVLS